jgi:hypothetical protein
MLALRPLDALQAIEYQEVRTPGHQGNAEQMQESGTLGRSHGRFIVPEVAIGLPQEVINIGLLIETPDEETSGTRRVLRPA